MKRYLFGCVTVCILLSGCSGGDSSSNSSQSQNTAIQSGSTSSVAPLDLSGVPSVIVAAGTRYSFRPTVSSGLNPVTLSFSIENAPKWASFNRASGELTGVPDETNVGNYSDIVIAVTDGQTSARLNPYSIAVTQVQNGSVTLTWIPPTENVDGTPLTDLAGYQISYGHSATSLDQIVRIDNPGTDSYVVANLAAGEWVFTVEAYNAGGTASLPSNDATALL